jgi:hypothetical protein
MMVCGMSSGKGNKASLCLFPYVRPTLANERFLEWTQYFVDRMLTAPPTAKPTDKAQSEMITLLAQVLQGQQQLQEDTFTARTHTSKTLKTVSGRFKAESTNSLMIHCDVVIESDLPDVWLNIASNGGKRDRQIIEAAFREIASELRMHSSKPVVTPGKKITDMRLVGNNLDNLDEGISPFSIVIIDSTTHPSEITYRTAIKVARNYDHLVKGVNIHLDDRKIKILYIHVSAYR